MQEPDPDEFAYGSLDRVAAGEVLWAIVDLPGQLLDGYLGRVECQQVLEDRRFDFRVFLSGGGDVIVGFVHWYIRRQSAELFPRGRL